MNKQKYIVLLYDNYKYYFFHDVDIMKYIGILYGVCQCAYEDVDIDSDDYDEIAEAKRQYIEDILKGNFNS